MKSELILIPSATIHPDKICLYNEVHWEPHRPSRKTSAYFEEMNALKWDHLLDSKRTANGKVSTIARRKMNKALDYLLFITRPQTANANYSGRKFSFKIAFITLTLASKQVHSDNDIKKQLLNQLLIELKQHYKVKHYVWRAEKQKNGNLHFHLIVNKFIPHQELRDRWNRIQNKLGYIDRYREEQQNWHKNGFRVRENLLKTWPLAKQKQAYERGAKMHWNSPNSTDIHSVQKVLNIKQYISKYLTKNEIKKYALKIEALQAIRDSGNVRLTKPPAKKRKLLLSNRRKRQASAKKMKQGGRIWGCNQELSNIKGAQVVVDNQLQQEIELIQSCRESRTYDDTYFSVVYFDITLLSSFPQVKLFQLFSRYLLDKFDFSLQTEIQ